jgi:hypothetical protein
MIMTEEQLESMIQDIEAEIERATLKVKRVITPEGVEYVRAYATGLLKALTIVKQASIQSRADAIENSLNET